MSGLGLLYIAQRISTGIYTGSWELPPKDRLSYTLWWKWVMHRQTILTANNKYEVCIFGDSISGQLGNNFGRQIFNFSIDGLSTVSLVEQLKVLLKINVQCNQAIIAIGTNDAWYTIDDNFFIKNLKQIISLVRSMGAKNIVLIPAFYSTVAASYDLTKAGPIPRIDEINLLIKEIAAKEKVNYDQELLEILYENKALNSDLTIDGVHLNQKGINIYKQIVLKIIKFLA